MRPPVPSRLRRSVDPPHRCCSAPASVGASGPRPTTARRCCFEGATQHVARPLPLEIEGLTAVRNLKLQTVAAHKALYRCRPVAGQMYDQLPVKEAIRLRPQSELHRHARTAADTVDCAGGE